jgi:hypothetical protein
MKFLLPATLLVLTSPATKLAAVEFDSDIAPILKEHCYECHSEARKKEKAGFVFDNKTRLKKSIGTNLVIEPGEPGRSHFLEVIIDPEIDNHMPPNKNLDRADVDKLRKWIAEGATLNKDETKMVAKKDLPPFLTWINADGKKVRAGFGGLDGQNVILKMPSGQLLPYPLTKLSAESQKQARECAEP